MLDTNILISTIEWVGNKWNDYISPVIILPAYEAGVLVRLGEYKKELKTGINFKIPLIDEVHTCIKTIDTFALNPIDITTTEGKQVSVEPIVMFEIIDPKKYLIDTNDAAGNIRDVSRGTIADYLADCTWEEVKEKKTLTAIKNAIKKECESMGIFVHKVFFARMVTTKVYTVFKE
jgi:regulator of protease activity HflC (stomatin/prohibitin superfamily)